MPRARTTPRKRTAVNKRVANLVASSLVAAQTGGDEPVPEASIEEQLSQAKASRNQAETARQKIANEILEATKEVCQKLISDGEQTLGRAKRLEAEAERSLEQAQIEQERARTNREDSEAFADKTKTESQKKAQEKLDQAQNIRNESDAYRERVMAEVQREAQEQLNQAQNIRNEADVYRERIMAEAKDQGQEILRLARSAAVQECDEMKNHAQLEARRTMAEAELVKAAVQEELEAQKIYAEAAKLETESLEVLAQVRAKLVDPAMFMNGSTDWEQPIVQLNAARESMDPGESPVPAVESAAKPRVASSKAKTTKRRRPSSSRGN